jgi:hypothetical protein
MVDAHSIPKDLLFIGWGNIGHRYLHEESIELYDWERIGSSDIKRVLRAKDKKEVIDGASDIIDSHLFFCHTLEEGSLYLRSCSIYLICEDDVSKDGSMLKSKVSGLGLKNGNAEDISWE